MVAYTAMMQDGTLIHPEDKPAHMEHLRQVCQDTVDWPWPAVRKWSNLVFDQIERGEITWADKQTIQYERMRTVMAVRPDQQMVVTVPCPKFNEGACQRSVDTHREGSVTFSHVCNYCSSVGAPGKNNHPATECAKRTKTVLFNSRPPQRPKDADAR